MCVNNDDGDETCEDGMKNFNSAWIFIIVY